MSTKLLRYALFNVFFVTCIYLGFFKGVDGAKTTAEIIAWSIFLLSVMIVLFINDKIVESVAKEPSTINRNLDLILDIAIVVAFAYGNAWATAGVYFAHVLMMMVVRDKLDKVRAIKEKEKTKEPVKEINMNFFQP